MKTYTLSPGVLKTFASPGEPFLTFDQFVTIVQWYRDVHYAPESIPGFSQDIGCAYNIWTRSTVSNYLRHIFPQEVTGEIRISFEIPSLENASWFPILVRMFDENGLYFWQEQKIVIERNIGGRFSLTSWKKIPAIRAFLMSECPRKAA